jgi:hypothetical protein
MHLASGKVDDEAVIYVLKNLPQLITLDIATSAITPALGQKLDAALKSDDESLMLESLDVSMTQLTFEDVMKVVKKCPMLRSLNMIGIPLNDGDLVTLITQKPDLQELKIGDSNSSRKSSFRSGQQYCTFTRLGMEKLFELGREKLRVTVYNYNSPIGYYLSAMVSEERLLIHPNPSNYNFYVGDLERQFFFELSK